MKQKESPRELKHKARRLSIKEGIFASVKNSFGQSYISPFAIAINASNSLVAFLTSVSGIFGPLSQLFGSKLMRRHSRKKIVTQYVFLESLVWISFIIIAILFYKGIIVSVLPFLVLLFFSLYIIFGNVAYPPWFSWIGDIVDKKYRGRWFSKRRLIDGFVLGILTIVAAIFLDVFRERNFLMLGFIALFSLAFIFRVMSISIFKNQYEPKLKLKKEDYFSFWDFLKKSRKNNFGRFSIFMALLNFASAISSSLIAVYLLRYLGFNYLTYMVIISAGGGFALVSLAFWGKFADKYGNYKVLGITTMMLPIVPILWILNDSPIYLIFVPFVIHNVALAGFGLSTTNFVYDNVNTKKMGLMISYHNLLSGIGVFLGAGLGALLIKYLQFDFIEPLLAIFILSAFLMMVVVFWWIPELKEVRKTEKLKNYSNVFKELIIKGGAATISEEIHQLMAIKTYLKEK